MGDRLVTKMASTTSYACGGTINAPDCTLEMVLPPLKFANLQFLTFTKRKQKKPKDNGDKKRKRGSKYYLQMAALTKRRRIR